MLLTVERHAKGPRVRLAKQRIHHGATGALLALHPRTRIIGIVLMAHDRHDVTKWFRPGPQFDN